MRTFASARQTIEQRKEEQARFDVFRDDLEQGARRVRLVLIIAAIGALAASVLLWWKP